MIVLLYTQTDTVGFKNILMVKLSKAYIGGFIHLVVHIIIIRKADFLPIRLLKASCILTVFII